MARASDGTCPHLRYQPRRIWVLLTVLFLTMGQDCRASTMEKSTKYSHRSQELPLLMQRKSKFENCVQTLFQTVASHDAKITNFEQIVSSLAARVTTLKTNATSVSSGSGSARSWNILGHSDGWSSDDNRDTRRRLDPLSCLADDHARSAVLQRFPLRAIPQRDYQLDQHFNTLWEESNMPADNKLVTIHCKAGSTSVRLVFETRPKCQDFVVRNTEDGIPYVIDSPYCCTKYKYHCSPIQIN